MPPEAATDTDDAPGVRPNRRALANERPIVLGQAVSLFGDYIAYFTLPWLVLELTGQGADLGLTAFSETIPVLLFGFAAGVLLDRYRIRRVLIGADLVRAVLFVTLAAAVATDVVRPGIVFAIAFVFGTMTVFFDAGLQTMLPSVVTDAQLVGVNSKLSLARTLSFSLGPAVGGILVASSGGFEVAFLLNTATFLVSALFLMRVRELRPPARLSSTTRFDEALRRGLRFLARDPHLRWATLGAVVTNIVFAPLEALLVLFVDRRLAGMIAVPSWLEWLFTRAGEVGLFIGLQAAIGSIAIILAPRVARRLSLGRMYIIGMIMLGAGFATVSLMSSFAAVIPAGVAVGGVGWVNVAFVTMRQRITPPPLLGRVTAASRTIAYALIPLGAAGGGFAADAIGLVPVYLFGSIATMVVAALLVLTPLWWRVVPEAPRADWPSDALQTMGIPNRRQHSRT